MVTQSTDLILPQSLFTARLDSARKGSKHIDPRNTAATRVSAPAHSQQRPESRLPFPSTGGSKDAMTPPGIKGLPLQDGHLKNRRPYSWVDNHDCLGPKTASPEFHSETSFPFDTVFEVSSF